MSKLLNKDYTIDLPHNLIIFPLNNSMRNSVYNSIRSLINDLLYDSIIFPIYDSITISISNKGY